MVVEDEALVARDIKASLEAMGYGVAAVIDSGEEAVVRAAEDGPDIILMDVRLKGEMDGVEAAAQIRSRLEIPVVFVTAHAEEALLERAKLSEPFGYVLKPFQDRELRAAIETALSRSEMESQLRESKERLQKVFESQRDSILILDAAVPPRIIDCNSASRRVFGYEKEEMIGQTTAILHADEASLKKFQSQLYPAMESRGFFELDEFAMKRKDGLIFPTKHMVAPLVDRQGRRTGWISVIRDITERKMDEAALKESEARLRAIFEHAAVGMCQSDGRGNLQKVNQSFCDLLGRQPDELLGRNIWDLTHPDDLKADKELSARVVAQEIDDWSLEKRFLRRDGASVWAHATVSVVREPTGEVRYAIGVVQDISERKRTEEALKESEARFRRLVERMNEGLVMTDERNVFTYVNDQFCQMVGHSSEELLGMAVVDLLDEENRRINLKERAKRRAGGRGAYELILLRPDGGRVHTIVSPTGLFDEEGLFRGSFAVITDITARKRVEEERERLITELEEALAEVKKLSGLIPICAKCKKIRDDTGYWEYLEKYISERSEAQFSHSICPECARKLYPELYVDEED